MRINPRVMRIAGEQMHTGPAAHTMGIGAASVWLVCRLRDGRIAVGSFGGVLMTVDEVAEAIKEFQRLPPDGGHNTVGS